MQVFDLRDKLIKDYSEYSQSYIKVKDPTLKKKVSDFINRGLLWPEPLIQMNPSFEGGGSISNLVERGILHRECKRIFSFDSNEGEQLPINLYRHQAEAVEAAVSGDNYVLTTGTGSGKSLSYIIPIVDHVLKTGSGKGIKAIIVYPMNALANSQKLELDKFLDVKYGPGNSPVTYRRYTGQESDSEKKEIQNKPPDILLTNYVMLELILTRYDEKKLIEKTGNLKFLVLDELHTYRGRQGADVAMLMRRVRNSFKADDLQMVGTSATLAGEGSFDEQRAEVAKLATRLFGAPVKSKRVIGETLKRVTKQYDFDKDIKLLQKRVSDETAFPGRMDFDAFVADPLSSWIEDTFGIKAETGSGRLIRQNPRAVRGHFGAAFSLNKITEIDTERCIRVIEATLLAGHNLKGPDGRGIFAFRLHQFLNRGDTIYMTLEGRAHRFVTPHGQIYAPESAAGGKDTEGVKDTEGGAVFDSGSIYQGEKNSQGGKNGEKDKGVGRDKFLFPAVMCRECGREYLMVWEEPDSNAGAEGQSRVRFTPRHPSVTRSDEGDIRAGYLMLNEDGSWPSANEIERLAEKLPEDWCETVHLKTGTVTRVKKNKREYLPIELMVRPDGSIASVYSGQDSPATTSPPHVDEGGREDRDRSDGNFSGTVRVCYIPEFKFCLDCGVTYSMRLKSDFGKVSTLGTGGRSTATTILSLSLLRHLQKDEDLKAEAKKLLSFTDNRQDASLQAGHFNDFIEVGLLRSALYKALASSGSRGLTHENLTALVFKCLDLDFELFAADPMVRFQAKAETERALREVIGYRLYRDLERGWRITAPNLEQCGLLKFGYLSLADLCREEDVWKETHEALAKAKPETRASISRVLLDYLRRELAIKVDYLEPLYQEKIKQLSSQRLSEPWAIDDDEKLLSGAMAFPGKPNNLRGVTNVVTITPRGGFGQYLKRLGTFPDFSGNLGTADLEKIICDLFEALRVAGLVEIVKYQGSEGKDEPKGYQVPAACFQWMPGEGIGVDLDPIRIPRPTEGGSIPNSFFVKFYCTVAAQLKGLEAREHTAQVQAAEREIREMRFRMQPDVLKAEKLRPLPILYCSPTMELGVDIAELNSVNMRNVPPTPANYAQRSGRAGRCGQPALVFTYCTTGSSHDQFFFKRPQQMVAGRVCTPRIDLSNEDLIRSHVHAIWLEASGVDLGKTLVSVLDLKDEPSLPVVDSIKSALKDTRIRSSALGRAEEVLKNIETELNDAYWYGDDWLHEVLDQIASSFEASCERWRELYMSAVEQQRRQNDIINDVSRSQEDKKRAHSLRSEAESQKDLLTVPANSSQSDFYSYRYFACEGFLPGYNFPRLPLTAYIPGRRRIRGLDEFLARPRFIAISEFGPGSIIYHEGSKYIIDRVSMDISSTGQLVQTSAKICGECGYFHPIETGDGAERCEYCDALLDNSTRSDNLFKLKNVFTRRRERINSDEEERRRLGYEIKTTLRFPVRGNKVSSRSATISLGDEALLKLTHGQGAELVRTNLGWSRRRQDKSNGFHLDTERGKWTKNPLEEEADAEPESISKRVVKVIPFVRDSKNCLLIEPLISMDVKQMATLQNALKKAIQLKYQLEDNELYAEPLPSNSTRRQILIYESAEGGAGVLKQLVDDPTAMGAVAAVALEVCHFDTLTGTDQMSSPGKETDEGKRCNAACYDCLMSYSNQRDHMLLDRHCVKELLIKLKGSSGSLSPVAAPRSDHFVSLKNTAESSLEARWLDFISKNELILPNDAQKHIPESGTRADFYYTNARTAIYIDGPHHDFSDRKERDRETDESLADMGIKSVRFGSDPARWHETILKHPSVFGPLRKASTGLDSMPRPATESTIQDGASGGSTVKEKIASEVQVIEAIGLIPSQWRETVARLIELPGVTIEPGNDLADAAGRVAGSSVAEILFGTRKILIIDSSTLESGNGIQKLRGAVFAAGADDMIVASPDDQDLKDRILLALKSPSFDSIENNYSSGSEN